MHRINVTHDDHTDNKKEGPTRDESTQVLRNTIIGGLKLIVITAAIFAITVAHNVGIPSIFGWTSQWYEVDRKTCDCSCWDARNKIPYHKGGYKSIFYNIDEHIGYIYTILLMYAFACFKLFEKVLNLVLRGEFRWMMFPSLASVVWANYYGCWVYYHYINDKFFAFMIHQTYFSMTEVLVAVLTYYLIDAKFNPQPIHLWVIFVVPMTHIFQSLVDQGFTHLLFGGAQHKHHTYRDMGFVVTDGVVSASAALWLWYLYRNRAGLSPSLGKRHTIYAFGAIAVVMFLVAAAFPTNE